MIVDKLALGTIDGMDPKVGRQIELSTDVRK
jgi:hypothetical protein